MLETNSPSAEAIAPQTAEAPRTGEPLTLRFCGFYDYISDDTPLTSKEIVLPDGSVPDVTDPLVAEGAALALAHINLEVGYVITPKIERAVKLLETLSSKGGVEALEEGGFHVAAQLVRLQATMFEPIPARAERDKYACLMRKQEIIDKNPEQYSDSWLSFLRQRLLIEGMAAAGPGVIKDPYRLFSLSDSSDTSEYPHLAETTWLSAARMVSQSRDIDFYDWQTLSDSLTRQAYRDGGVELQSKIVHVLTGLDPKIASVIIESFRAEYADSSFLLLFLAATNEQGKKSINVEDLLQTRIFSLCNEAIRMLGDETYLSPQDLVNRSENIFMVMRNLLEYAGEFDGRHGIELVMMDVIERFFADEEQLYDKVERGQLGTNKDDQQYELIPRQPEFEIGASTEYLLGMLAGLTSKTRRYLLRHDSEALQNEAGMAQQIQQELGSRDGMLGEITATRLASHYMAIGGDFLTEVDRLIDGIPEGEKKLKLSASAELARTLEHTAMDELVKLQAAYLTAQSKLPEYTVNDSQRAEAIENAEHMEKSDSVIRIRLKSLEALMDLLHGSRRIKTMWETKSTGGISQSIMDPMDDGGTYLSVRQAAEQVVGTAEHHDHPSLFEPPVSGYVKPIGHSPGSTVGYGFVEVLLNSATIKDRVVFVDGDSANEALKGKVSLMNWQDGILAAAQKAILVRDEVITPPPNTMSVPRGWDYVEAIVLGGVTIEDVKAIRIITEKLSEDVVGGLQKLLVPLEESGIQVSFVRSEHGRFRSRRKPPG
jgi:hypothetical protein